MLRRFALALIPFALVACTESSGGNVALELTDAPADLSTLEHVDLTLGEVGIHVVSKKVKTDDVQGGGLDQKGQWVTVNSHAGTFDLLALRDDVTAPLGDILLPSGKITQVRLHIDPEGRNVAVLKTGEECPIDLSEVDESGIKIAQSFEALEPPIGGRLTMVIDFDLEDSLEMAGDCSFKLEPVLKLKETKTEDTIKQDKAQSALKNEEH